MTAGEFIRAVKQMARWEREQNRFRVVFGALTPTRKERKRVDDLARRLLLWHIERGHTLETIGTMLELAEESRDE